MLDNADFQVIQFAFNFYGFKTYHALVNPHNPVVRAVLTTLVESGDYYFIQFATDGKASMFRSEGGDESLAGLRTNLPMIMNSMTTEGHCLQAGSLFEKKMEPAGVLLDWVCRDTMEYLDLTRDRLQMTE